MPTIASNSTPTSALIVAIDSGVGRNPESGSSR
jgi:hypothetical protein